MLKMGFRIILVSFFFCVTVTAQEFVSPDKQHRASVIFDSGKSKVEILSSKGDLLATGHYSTTEKPFGNRLVHASWSPDSKYFIFSMEYTNIHPSWSCLTYFYSV